MKSWRQLVPSVLLEPLNRLSLRVLPLRWNRLLLLVLLRRWGLQRQPARRNPLRLAQLERLHWRNCWLLELRLLLAQLPAPVPFGQELLMGFQRYPVTC